MVGIGDDFEDLLKQVRTKEKNAKNKDFNKIKVIDSYLDTRASMIAQAKDRLPSAVQKEEF